MYAPEDNRRIGFSLIELAIVLVIMGLIVGSIFLGKNLITAAKVRGDIQKMQQITTGINDFEIKYNALPGDITSSDAANLGFTGVGNGDWVLQDSGGNLGYPMDTAIIGLGESEYVFYQLATVNMIAGSYTPAGAVVNWAPNLKSHKFFYFNLITPNTYDGLWYFVGFNGVPVTDAFTYFNATRVGGTYSPVYTPAEAFYIDSKLDDGIPSTGNVVAVYVTGPSDVLDTRPASCVYDATATNYNIKQNTQQCDLLVRADQ